MNPNELERLILLEQSGELTARQRRALDAALAASPEARRFRDQLRALAAAVPEPDGPAPEAAARIADRLREKTRPSFVLLPAWKPALAAAAALALLVGVRSFRPVPAAAPVAETAAVAAAADEDWADPLDADFTELESLLAAMTADASYDGITEL